MVNTHKKVLRNIGITYLGFLYVTNVVTQGLRWGEHMCLTGKEERNTELLALWEGGCLEYRSACG